jgi:uncharacterized protein (TIGR02466 family)
MFSDELEMLWPTPVATRIFNEVQEFNTHLEKTILELQKTDIGKNKSNCMGWHSTGNLFQNTSPELEDLQEIILQFISDYVVEVSQKKEQVGVKLFAWANVLNPGGYNNVHNHPNSHISGVYYINTGELDSNNPNSGLIAFSDPRAGAGMVSSSYLDFGASYQYTPEPGMLLLFPAYLWHWVHPFTGQGQRITVSFNANLIEPIELKS